MQWRTAAATALPQMYGMIADTHRPRGASATDCEHRLVPQLRKSLYHRCSPMDTATHHVREYLLHLRTSAVSPLLFGTTSSASVFICAHLCVSVVTQWQFPLRSSASSAVQCCCCFLRDLRGARDRLPARGTPLRPLRPLRFDCCSSFPRFRSVDDNEYGGWRGPPAV